MRCFGGLSDQPFLIQEKGFETEAVTFADLGVNLLGFSLLAHDDLIEENPDLVQRFVSATNRGWEEARNDPEAVMPALTNVKPDFNIERGLGQLKVMIDLMDTPNTEGTFRRLPCRRGLGGNARFIEAVSRFEHRSAVRRLLHQPVHLRIGERQVRWVDVRT